ILPPLQRLRGRSERDRRRAHDDRPRHLARKPAEEVAEEFAGRRGALVELPVAGDHRQSKGHEPTSPRVESSSTPGSGLPSRNSSEAPPPVETCETSSCKPRSRSAAA